MGREKYIPKPQAKEREELVKKKIAKAICFDESKKRVCEKNYFRKIFEKFF